MRDAFADLLAVPRMTEVRMRNLIVAAGEQPVASFAGLGALAATAAEDPVTVTLQRGARRFNVSFPVEEKEPAALEFAGPPPGILLESVPAETPASKAGLEPGDRVLGEAGGRSHPRRALERLLAGESDSPAFLEVKRGRRRLGVWVSPQ